MPPGAFCTVPMSATAPVKHTFSEEFVALTMGRETEEITTLEETLQLEPVLVQRRVAESEERVNSAFGSKELENEPFPETSDQFPPVAGAENVALSSRGSRRHVLLLNPAKASLVIPLQNVRSLPEAATAKAPLLETLTKLPNLSFARVSLALTYLKQY